MSSEEEATAANVLSQMSQIQQISCETIEATVINVGHHCDVETTASQVMEIVQAEVPDEEANEVLRRVHSAVQNMQQSSGVMDTNEQVHAQLDSGEVAILSGSGDSTAAVGTRIVSNGGVRPYKCDTCEKEFNYLTTYKRHLNIHKGEKPFACEHCDKKFTRLNYLKNHLNTHAKHASQESQTDFKYDDSSSRQNMDVDNQEDLGTMEADSAAQSIQNEGKSLVENEAGKADTEGELQTEAVKEQESEVTDTTKAQESKVPDTSLLQQVTQVLGEIVPHNLSAEVTEGAGGPQIVVQGADQAGSEFKITLAQQLLLAQHLLNQVQTQRLGRGGASGSEGEQDAEQPQITTVTIPEISAELAEQIVNQAAVQQATDLMQNPSGLIHVPSDANTSQGTGQTEMVVGTEVMIQEQAEGQHNEMVTEHVLQESTAVPVTSEDGVPLVDSNAVYVAIDPNQPDVQQLLGQIQAITASQAQQGEGEEPRQESE
ncbi:hypothetical protein pdam_00023203 [Pocillopora damicornis]|uniref:C2H2-type domain-containing protein n=1 Tax=Pocillopora damicornis TaxID=46731 RepID=A0A3M6V0Q9_POCDA|nr:hypothetical protein pdam_00023203 [Pocillopora damicornis]